MHCLQRNVQKQGPRDIVRMDHALDFGVVDVAGVSTILAVCRAICLPEIDSAASKYILRPLEPSEWVAESRAGEDACGK